MHKQPAASPPFLCFIKINHPPSRPSCSCTTCASPSALFSLVSLFFFSFSNYKFLLSSWQKRLGLRGNSLRAETGCQTVSVLWIRERWHFFFNGLGMVSFFSESLYLFSFHLFWGILLLHIDINSFINFKAPQDFLACPTQYAKLYMYVMLRWGYCYDHARKLFHIELFEQTLATFSMTQSVHTGKLSRKEEHAVAGYLSSILSAPNECADIKSAALAR